MYHTNKLLHVCSSYIVFYEFMIHVIAANYGYMHERTLQKVGQYSICCGNPWFLSLYQLKKGILKNFTIPTKSECLNQGSRVLNFIITQQMLDYQLVMQHNPATHVDNKFVVIHVSFHMTWSCVPKTLLCTRLIYTWTVLLRTAKY